MHMWNIRQCILYVFHIVAYAIVYSIDVLYNTYGMYCNLQLICIFMFERFKSPEDDRKIYSIEIVNDYDEVKNRWTAINSK